MVALSRAIGRKQAMEMLLTGNMIDAEQARQWGFGQSRGTGRGNSRMPSPRSRKEIAAKSPLTLAIGKRSLLCVQAELWPRRGLCPCASETMTRNMLARDAEEGIDAFLGKRTPVWEGR